MTSYNEEGHEMMDDLIEEEDVYFEEEENVGVVSIPSNSTNSRENAELTARISPMTRSSSDNSFSSESRSALAVANESSRIRSVEVTGLMPWSYLDEYYKFLEIDGKKVEAKCRRCNEVKSGYRNSPSNFKRHYLKIHNMTIKTDEDEELTSKSSLLQKKLMVLGIDQIMSEGMLREKIANFIVGGFHAFSTVEEDGFRKLILGLTLTMDYDWNIPTRRQVTTTIENLGIKFKTKLKAIFSSIDAVSITTDLWKSHNRAFLGITIHWIDEVEDMDKCGRAPIRKMAVLALRRMEYEITYKELGAIIESVLREYEIKDKVLLCTTDNGSNFIKAFRVYAERVHEEILEDDEDDMENEDIQFVQIAPILADPEPNYGNNPDPELLPHMRCASHTLNLIMKDESELPQRAKYVFSKCRTLWNAQSKATKTADFIKNKLGVYLTTPSETRWNSFFDAISCIVKHKQKLKVLTSQFSKGIKTKSSPLPTFTEDDFNIMEEYCQIMKWFAKALDHLQGEKNLFMGAFLPTIYSLRRRLLAIGNLTCCNTFLNDKINSLNTRFQDFWRREEFIIASCVHPCFKMSWIPQEDNELREFAINIMHPILNSCLNHSKENQPHTEDETEARRRYYDELFDFSIPHPNQNSASTNCKYEQFLNDSFNLNILNNYPCIKKIFLHYNVGLPSSAAIERVFSTTGDIFTKKRAVMTSAHLECSLQLNVGIQCSK